MASESDNVRAQAPDVSLPTTSPVLVVDLDRTLLASQSLQIAPTVSRSNPACRQPYETSALRYNESVLKFVRDARTNGRKIVLLSACDERLVKAVASHLGLFDETVTTGDLNGSIQGASARETADLLLARYGDKGFDYVGAHSEDLTIWAKSHRSFALNPSRETRGAARAQGIELIEIGKKWGASVWPLIRAMRPYQWVKNLLIFLPLVASHNFSAWGMAVIAFMVFSLAASSLYISNDIADLESDRRHPRKRKRPFASGEAQIADGIWLAMILVAAALAISIAFLPAMFVAILLLYMAVTSAYTYVLKRKLLVDIIVLAGLYTARILAGGAAANIVISPWLAAFSMFLFFSLAAIKRQAELVDHEQRSKLAIPGRAYSVADLPVVRSMAVSSGQAAVLVLALYINSSATAGLYAQPAVMWVMCPILFYWLSRMEVLTHRGFMNDDPIVFAFRDRISLLCLFANICIIIIAIIGVSAPW